MIQQNFLIYQNGAETICIGSITREVILQTSSASEVFQKAIDLAAEAQASIQVECAVEHERFLVAFSCSIMGRVDDHLALSPKCRSSTVLSRSSPVPATNHQPPTASAPSVKAASVTR